MTVNHITAGGFTVNVSARTAATDLHVASDPTPWRYRVTFSSPKGQGECEIRRTHPIRDSADEDSVAYLILQRTLHPPVAVTSYELLAGPTS